MKQWNLKLKDKILIYILPFIAITFLIISFLVYYQTKQIFLTNYNFQKEQIEANVIDTMQTIDSGFAMLEKHMEDEMKQSILEFKYEFEKAGGDPDEISLDAMKSRAGEKYDFVIIDSETTIIKSTIPDTINFNFLEARKPLGDIVNRMREKDSIQYERFSMNPGTGYLSIFAFVPTSDHKYLLEVAYTQPDLGSFVSELKPVNITSKLSKTNQDVVSIRVFDIFAMEFTDNGPNMAATKESLEIFERAKKEKRFEIKEGNIIKSYLYIDLKKDTNMLSDTSKTVEIVYDTTSFANGLERLSLICFLIGFLFMALMAFFITTLIKKTTYPITILADAANRVSNGDYGVVAKKLSRDEIGELTDIFNSMTAKIKEDFEKIEYQKTELERYNKNLEKMVDERTIELVHVRETIKKEKDVLESILNDTLSGYYDFDFVNKYLYFSSGFKKLLGYEDHELGTTFDEMKKFLVMEDEAIVTESFYKHIESHGEIPFYNEVRYKHKDGSIVWLIFTGHVIEWGPDNTPLQMIGCHINITDLKLLEKSLNQERELLKATLLSMGDAVITTDKDGNIGIVNAVAEKLTGWAQDKVAGEPFDMIFKFLNKGSKEKYKSPLDKVLNTGEMIQDQNQMIIISKEGKEIPIEDSASPITDENGNINGAVLVFRDYTEKKEKQAKIEYLSLHDQLTGLYNRRFLEEELKRLDTGSNLPLTIVMLDVNGLKLINDAFGHAIGDLTLQRAAIIMREECRGDEIIARFGGDEFVILLPRTNPEDAEGLVKRIYTAFETEIIDKISVSVSCGWATKQDHSENLAAVFKLAEDHMYRRKLSESKSMHHKTIDTILKTLHGKSEREKNHSERVGELCESIATALNMNPEDVKEFRTIGLMHDIGKIAIDLSILDKPGKLDKMEQAEIERHPELGYQILRSINEFAKLAEYTLSHHERWDGTGYPRRLKGAEIPFEARIIAIADAYDSMTSDRAYRKAMDKESAMKEILGQAGKQFDPDVVKIFVEKVYGSLN